MQLTLLLLALVGLATAAVYQMPLIKIDSPRIQMMRKGVWRDMVKQRNADRLKLKASAQAFSDNRQDVYNYHDIEYVGNITIGNPEQPFQYRGGRASGIYARDTVRFGAVGKQNRLEVLDVVVGRATKISKTSKDLPFDGVLGLGFETIATNKAIQPPFVRAHKDGIVRPIFTVHLRHIPEGGVGFGGVYTYGGIDRENCDSDFVYEPLTEPGFWQFKLRSISIGGFTSSLGWQAVTSTASGFIAAPQSIADAMAKATRAEEDGYFLDCDGFPTPRFGIGRNRYQVEGYNFMITLAEYKCILSLYGMDGGAFGPSWILGAPFMRQYCNIHDMEKKQIGFAKSLK
ncbi:eukaryotic aspartyl protease [Ancylostoma duodenale]|uniref:Eukaryotic aspartyl protease n=1 Tax=Ancylostoma duodenale TaxID=51022 RepID=A0A0C2DKA2_9BILA|nr:eukaryotic aspartyl protease [Ancylostoma duodenale]